MTEHPSLTEREIEILQQVATGASNRQIAQQLGISANTVKVHLRNIFEKTGAASRTEATLYAIRTGLVEGVESTLVTVARPWWQRGWVIAGGALVLTMLAILVGVLVNPSEPLPENVVDLEQLERDRWQELAPMPTARKGLAVAAYDGKIYAIAGETEDGVTDVVERYDPATDTWETLPPKPTAVTDVQAAVIGGKIYVPGGRLSSGGVTDVLEAYDPLADVWTTFFPIPASLSKYGLQAYEGELYLFGGWKGRRYSDAAFRYTPGEDSWTRLVDDAKARGDAGVLLFGNELLLLGGYDGEDYLSDIDVYLPDQEESTPPSWRYLAAMPYANAGMGVVTFADIIYVIGGVNGPDRFFRYFPRTDEWREVETPITSFGDQVSVASIEDFIYILSGESYLQDHYRYRAVYTVFIPFLFDSQ